jgi:hypothetical protein
MPFIKYNPGFRRENMYRLYSEKLSNTGKKIPYLPSSEILKLSKEIGKSGNISLLIKTIFEGSPIQLYIHFKRDGNVQVQSSLVSPISTSSLNQILLQVLNPIIDNINEFLNKTGYSIRRFTTLHDNYIIINNIQYTSSVSITKKMDLEKYKSCISSIFVIKDTNISGTDGAKLIFKRVENYQEMDPIEEFITIEKNKLTEVGDIIQALVNEFDLTQQDAEKRVVDFFKVHTMFNDKIIENFGFPVSIKLFPIENKLKLEVSNINAIEYIEVLSIYFDSILRIYQAPNSTEVSLKQIESVCKKKINYEEVDKTNIQNIVAIAPVIGVIPQAIELDNSLDSDFFKEGSVETPKKQESVESTYDELFGMDVETTLPINDMVKIKSSSQSVNGEKDDDDDDEFFGMDVDEDEEIEGGEGPDDLEINVEGKKLKNPNPFQSRIEDWIF